MMDAREDKPTETPPSFISFLLGGDKPAETPASFISFLQEGAGAYSLQNLSKEIPAEGILMPDGKRYSNFSTFESALTYAVLNSSTTGCYAQNGSMPILLAQKDECNLGFFCPNTTDTAPPQ